jgi:hypothetical protein
MLPGFRATEWATLAGMVGRLAQGTERARSTEGEMRVRIPRRRPPPQPASCVSVTARGVAGHAPHLNILTKARVTRRLCPRWFGLWPARRPAMADSHGLVPVPDVIRALAADDHVATRRGKAPLAVPSRSVSARRSRTRGACFGADALPSLRRYELDRRAWAAVNG